MTWRVLEVRHSALRVVRSREYRVLLSLITSLVEQPQLGLQSFKLPHRLEKLHWENILASDGPGPKNAATRVKLLLRTQITIQSYKKSMYLCASAHVEKLHNSSVFLSKPPSASGASQELSFRLHTKLTGGR